MTRYLFLGAIVLGIAAAIAGERPTASEPDRTASPSSRHETDAALAAAASTGGGGASALVLRRASSGQFHMTAQVNGEDVRFIVDTGADVVALTVEEAQRLGLDVDPGQFHAIGQSAPGTAYGAALRLERVEIDGHELTDVEAVVLDGLRTNLLGQSVLRRLGRVELQRDTMVVRAST